MSETSRPVPRPRSVSPLPPSQSEHVLSPDELTDECHRLRDENRQLQLRILGVNELARLLQERSDTVRLYEEKNKRLEVAVVRLENRYANLERKMQKGGAVPGVKQGISPFIPGPSKQILEGLMKENSELKKTLNNMSRRGGSGYLEAVVSVCVCVCVCEREACLYLGQYMSHTHCCSRRILCVCVCVFPK